MSEENEVLEDTNDVMEMGTVVMPLPEDESDNQKINIVDTSGFNDSLVGHSFGEEEEQQNQLADENLEASGDIFGSENLHEFIIPNEQSKLDKKEKELSKLKNKTTTTRQPPVIISEEQTFEILSGLGIKETIDPIILSKIDAAEMINIPFFINLREILCMYNIKSQVMDLFNVRKSYTGYHEFIKGERLDLPAVGFNSIAKSVNFSILQLPINSEIDEEDRIMIDRLQEKFLNNVRVSIESNLVANSKIKDKNEPKKERQPESNDEFLKLIQSKNSGTSHLLNNNLDLTNNYGLSESAVFKDDTTDFSSLLVETKSFSEGINTVEEESPLLNMNSGSLYGNSFVSDQNFDMVSIDLNTVVPKKVSTEIELNIEQGDKALLDIINSLEQQEN